MIVPNTQRLSQTTGDAVQDIFKYSGDGGNGDPGKLIYPTVDINTINQAKGLVKHTNHKVMTTMVAYTLQLSGGTSFLDLTNHLITINHQMQESKTPQFQTLSLNPANTTVTISEVGYYKGEMLS